MVEREEVREAYRESLADDLVGAYSEGLYRAAVGFGIADLHDLIASVLEIDGDAVGHGRNSTVVLFELEVP